MKRSTRRTMDTEPEDIETLRGRLEVAELKNALLETQRENERLKTVLDQQCNIIKENTALLRRQRLPRRPYLKVLNSTAKALIAQEQGCVCANPDGTCLLFKIGDGRFGKDLYECDHIVMWSRSGRHTGNLRVLCSYCHAVVTRQQLARVGTPQEESNEVLSEQGD